MDCWVLDDGFQHRQLHRDFDCVLVDAAGAGSDKSILPLGQLREPACTGLPRADMLVFTRFLEAHREMCNAVANRFGKPWAAVKMHSSFPGAWEDHDGLWSSRCLVASSIARPKRFVEDLRELGLNIGDVHTYPDHTRIPARVLSSPDHSYIVTTEKDYARHPDIFDSAPLPIAVMPLSLKCTDDTLTKAIIKRLTEVKKIA